MQKRLFLSQLLEQLFKFDLLDYFKVSKIPLCLFKISNEQNIFMFLKTQASMNCNLMHFYNL